MGHRRIASPLITGSERKSLLEFADVVNYMFNSGRDVWAPELLPKRPDLNMAQVERYLHDLYRAAD